MKPFLPIFLLLYAGPAFAQGRPNAPNVANTAATPSIAASAYNRENQVPVNHYTGLPQIGIPIYSFQNERLSDNISLSYFAGGVKLSEPAGNTGLNWSLQAGGAITRSVQGLPDDMPTAGWLSRNNVRPYDYVMQTEYDEWGNPQEVEIPIHRLPEYYDDAIDAQPDIFQVNAGGLSAKFYLAKDGSVLMAPKQNITITPTHNIHLPGFSTIAGFQITDAEGVSYYFTEREITTLVNTTTNAANNGTSGLYGKPHTTAWFLTSVVSPFGEDTIHYHYSNTSVTRNLLFPPSQFDVISGHFLPSSSHPTGQTTIQGKRLESIAYPDQTLVDLIYDNFGRLDLVGESALLRIEIKNPDVKSGFQFHYLYGSERGWLGYYGGTYETDLRLVLKSVVPFTPAGVQNGYVFDYDDYRKLPSVSSAAQDHWGFFNDKTSNTSLIPELGSYGGANRKVDPLAVKAYSLKTITYPSGGTTTLDMEPNDYFTVRKIEHRYAVEGTYPFSKLTADDTNFELKVQISPDINELDPGWRFCGFELTIEGLHQGQWVAGTTIPGGNKIVVGPFLTFWNTSVNLNFPPGTSQIRLTKSPLQNNHGCETNVPYTMEIGWHNEVHETDPDLLRTGGLRVKRIIDYDGIQPAPASVREFRYRSADGSSSSGFVKATPTYHYYMRFTHNGNNHGVFLVRSGMPVNFQHYTQGSIVGYGRVEEIFGTPERNLGKKEYLFTTYQDYRLPHHITDYPHVPEQVEDWLLGLPKVVKSYDAAGRLTSESFSEWKRYRHHYSPTDSALQGLRMAVAHEWQWNSHTTNRIFEQKYYRPVSGWVALSESKEVTYFEKDTLHYWTKYEYDTARYLPVKTITQTDRKRNILEETFTYFPFHYTIPSGPVAELRTRKIDVPIATETWEVNGPDRRLKEASLTGFTLVNGHQIKAAQKYDLITSGPVALNTVGDFNPAIFNRNPALIRPTSEVTAFDHKGNALETHNPVTGQYEAVIRDYANQQVVATVSNARLNQIAYTSFESGGKGSWAYAGTPQSENPRSVMGKLSYSLSSGAITKTNTPGGVNYIISFWAKVGTGTAQVSPHISHQTQTNPATGWTYHEWIVPGGATYTVSGTATIDELRLYPNHTGMQSVNVEPLVGVISTCDAGNTIRYQEYDEANRRVVVRDKDWNIVQASQTYQKTDNATNRTPQWVDVAPLTLSCEKLPGTQYNNGNQLKLQRDINPFSFSYEAFNWVFHGSNPSACPIMADWQPTGQTRCLLNNGVRTGVQEREERDMHPLSQTFGQPRWVNLGVNGNCPPIQYKVRVEYRNEVYAYDWFESTVTGDVYLVVTDQDGNPVAHPSLTVNYRKDQYQDEWLNWSSNYSANITNASEIHIFSGTLSRVINYPDLHFFSSQSTQFVVLPGTGYTPF
jgi:hypothetical protein